MRCDIDGYQFKFVPDPEANIETSPTRASHTACHFSCTSKADFTRQQLATTHHPIPSRQQLDSILHDPRRTSSRLDQVSDGDTKQDVARAHFSRLREDRVAGDQMASLAAQGSLVVRIVGCWLVCATASRSIRVSVTPGIAESHRPPESGPHPSRSIKSGSNQQGSWTTCQKCKLRLAYTHRHIKLESPARRPLRGTRYQSSTASVKDEDASEVAKNIQGVLRGAHDRAGELSTKVGIGAHSDAKQEHDRDDFPVEEAQDFVGSLVIRPLMASSCRCRGHWGAQKWYVSFFFRPNRGTPFFARLRSLQPNCNTHQCTVRRQVCCLSRASASCAHVSCSGGREPVAWVQMQLRATVSRRYGPQRSLVDVRCPLTCSSEPPLFFRPTVLKEDMFTKNVSIPWVSSTVWETLPKTIKTPFGNYTIFNSTRGLQGGGSAFHWLRGRGAGALTQQVHTTGLLVCSDAAWSLVWLILLPVLPLLFGSS